MYVVLLLHEGWSRPATRRLLQAFLSEPVFANALVSLAQSVQIDAFVAHLFCHWRLIHKVRQLTCRVFAEIRWNASLFLEIVAEGIEFCGR